MKHQLPLILLLAFKSAILLAQPSPVKIDLVSNGNILNAYFYPAHDRYSPTLILAHGFPGNNQSPLGLAEKINSAGINILAFNYQGSFSSEGRFNDENSIHDINVALEFFKQEKTIRQFGIDTSRITVCGHSLGGGYVLTAALYNPGMRKVISIGGSDNSVHIKKMKADTVYRESFEKRISGAFTPDGPINCDLQSFHSYNESIIIKVDLFDLVKNAEKLKDKEILFIVGWLDTTAPIEEHCLPLYRKLKLLKSDKVSIKAFDTNHGFGNVKEDMIKVIVDWTKN
ncbi:MAG: alpha/beta hydrolase [Bacteroidales bacterium]|jgi:fermentation-respiration switch protein FrsA (DUF1100 family)|nr:alpha/beta hydrolase [Bacteroidales bacterium]